MTQTTHGVLFLFTKERKKHNYTLLFNICLTPFLIETEKYVFDVSKLYSLIITRAVSTIEVALIQVCYRIDRQV